MPSLPPTRYFLRPLLTTTATAAIIIAALIVLSSTTRAAPENPTPAPPSAELGRPFLQTFLPRDYHAASQVMSATQDARGILYFGTRGLVLEYDGTSWRQIPIGDTTFMRGLATDPATDTVYVGGVNELGYLATALDGSKSFVSLRDRLPADARECRDIWQTHATPAGIFFVASQQVMRWRDGRFKVWKLPNPDLIRSFWVNDHLFLQPTGSPLLRLDGEDFTPVCADPALTGATVRVLLPQPGAPPGTLLVGTQANAFFLLGPDGALSPYPTGADDWFKAQGVNGGVRLSDGSVAVGTRRNGLAILGPAGGVTDRVDESMGLTNDFVYAMFVDRRGSLWLCLNAGICHVETPSAFTVFDSASGLKHVSVYDEARFNGQLVIASNAGVYRLAVPAPVPGEPPPLPRFSKIPGLDGRFSTVLGLGRGGLLAAGEPGIYHVAGDGQSPPVCLRRSPAIVLHPSLNNPDRVFTGGYDGEIRSLRYAADGHWADEGLVAKLDDEVRSLAETPRGDLWVGTPQHGAIRVQFAPGDDAGSPRRVASVTPFLGTHGLPPNQGWTRVNDWPGLLLTTRAGMYLFDEAKEIFRPATEFGPRLTGLSFQGSNSTPDHAGNLWLSGHQTTPGSVLELGRAVPARDGQAPRWQPLPDQVIDKTGEVQGIFPENRGSAGGEVVWLGGTDGIVRADVSRWLAHAVAAPVATVLRRVSTTAPTDKKAPPQPVPLAGVTLPYARNSLAFEYAAGTYAVAARPRYQTRLEGFGRGEWSDWDERASTSYTNLPEGRYTFHVRSTTAETVPGPATVFAFRVLPPWQRTPWAYAAAALLAAAFLYGIMRWRLTRFERQTATLEGVVATRTSELVRAKEAADDANRAKSVFLANMSHELRTPLNAILGYTQILLKDSALSPRNRERLSVVSQSGNHLLTMINEVLDLSKIEAGKLTVDATVFPFGQLLDEAVAVFGARAAEKGLEFRAVRAPGLPTVVRADVGKLRQVLFNLLGNAAKFTRQGSVELRVAPAGAGAVRFEVTDTGVGIAADELENIFLAFHQAADTGLASQGAGLGLAISRRLVEMLGGALEVASTPGQGSRFWFELALPEATGDSVASPPPAAPVGYRGARRRLLLVDDEPDNRGVLRGLLEGLGFEIEEAASGAACLERCGQPPAVDLVLLDLRMPDLDGFAAARALRHQEASRGIKIVAVSASVFTADQQQAIEAGCDDFLPKPFTERQLLDVLGRVLALEWIAAAPAAPALPAVPVAPPVGDENATPPAGELDALLELSQRGDILKLKKRLRDLRDANAGRYGAFISELEPLVASYRMNDIRDALLRHRDP